MTTMAVRLRRTAFRIMGTLSWRTASNGRKYSDSKEEPDA
jgi:hypothetical protein